MAASMVQYVVVRGDLLHSLKWPTGAVIAQACHACTAVLHLYKEDENVVTYTADLDNMHKVVLEAKNEESLRGLAEKLHEGNVDHKLWIEQPENYATCLAVKPYPKEDTKIF
ncbi:putative peptidyl-tRNA hydrolase PTRHD1 isoform X1 [Apostichopus japonicus]|uniref:peptidyl-tRNA hydrolase n=1 Tax=Stichopus japonicus TaxID=307972 RepID=A0A2G8KPU6_STIJA|nr:putative peptidyl-tRNA hydrolase PTRHD1 isoform X1 [Apostichopus japonicus]